MSRKYVQKCVCYGCNNRVDPLRGICLHRIPFVGDERPEAKRRRNKWAKFITTKRKDWKLGPKSRARVCSAHFRPEDFVNRYTSLYNTEDSHIIKRLVSDDFGVLAYPTIHAGEGDQNIDITSPSPSPRERRIIMREIMNDPLYASILHPEKIKTEENNSNQSTMDNDESQKLNTDHGNNISASQTDSTDISGKSCGSNCTADTDNARKISSSQCTSGTTVTSKTQDMSTQTLNYCKDCYRLKLTNYQQNNRIKSYQFKMKQKNATIMKLKRRVQKLELEKLGITKITAQPMVERTKGQLELIQLDHNYFG